MGVITRLPDNVVNSQALNDLNKVSLAIEKDYEYITSGTLFQTYKDSGSSASRILNLEDTLSSIESFSQNGNIVMARLKRMEVAVSQINNIASEYNTRLNKALSFGITDSTFQSYCQDQLNNIQNILNGQDADQRYIFGGYETTSPPVDISLMAFPVAGNPIDYSYYLGTNDVVNAYISQEVDLQYGVTANNPGFGNLIQALKIGAVTPPSDSLNSILRTDAMPQVEQAIHLIPDIQAGIGTSMKSVELAQERQVTKKEVTQDILDELIGADIVTSKINLDKNQIALQFSIIAYKEIGSNIDQLLYALKS